MAMDQRFYPAESASPVDAHKAQFNALFS